MKQKAWPIAYRTKIIRANIQFYSRGPFLKNASYESTSKHLKLKWTDETETKFLGIWMRDHCKCQECFDVQSGQRMLQRHLIPLDIYPKSLNISNEKGLEVVWSTDSNGQSDTHHQLLSTSASSSSSSKISQHQSLYSLSLLQEWRKAMFPFLFNNQSVHSPIEFPSNSLSISKIPTIDYHLDLTARISDSDESGIWNMLEHLNNTGIVHITNVPAGHIEKVATLIGCIRNTIYGPIWNVESQPAATNVAYTSRELFPHMDLLYYESPPGLQLLHCIRQSTVGGESTFVDVFHSAGILYRENVEYFMTLANIKLNFRKKDKDGRNFSYRRPLFQLSKNNNGEDVFLMSIYFSPDFEGDLINIENDNEPNQLKLFYEAYQRFCAILEKEKVTFKMVPGDLMCFLNRRVLHGRQAYRDPSVNGNIIGEKPIKGLTRLLQGCYVDTDEVINKFWQLKEKYDPDNEVPFSKFYGTASFRNE